MAIRLINSIVTGGDATFVRDSGSQAGIAATEGLHGSDAHFLDYDNDGFLDLWVIGKRENGDDRGILLFRNDGTSNFIDTSTQLPDGIAAGIDGEVGDYDNDGDLDLFLIGSEGQVSVFRNDGGNKNGWLQVRLEAVTAGNNKVNIDGIASRLELKAGDLYQMRNVAAPITHFRIGTRRARRRVACGLDERCSPKPCTAQGESAHRRKTDLEGFVSVPLRLRWRELSVFNRSSCGAVRLVWQRRWVSSHLLKLQITSKFRAIS